MIKEVSPLLNIWYPRIHVFSRQLSPTKSFFQWVKSLRNFLVPHLMTCYSASRVTCLFCLLLNNAVRDKFKNYNRTSLFTSSFNISFFRRSIGCWSYRSALSNITGHPAVFPQNEETGVKAASVSSFSNKHCFLTHSNKQGSNKSP